MYCPNCQRELSWDDGAFCAVCMNEKKMNEKQDSDEKAQTKISRVVALKKAVEAARKADQAIESAFRRIEKESGHDFDAYQRIVEDRRHLLQDLSEKRSLAMTAVYEAAVAYLEAKQ